MPRDLPQAKALVRVVLRYVDDYPAEVTLVFSSVFIL